jgi:hypothetical protein
LLLLVVALVSQEVFTLGVKQKDDYTRQEKLEMQQLGAKI